jgi:hypothetical protein
MRPRRGVRSSPGSAYPRPCALSPRERGAVVEWARRCTEPEGATFRFYLILRSSTSSYMKVSNKVVKADNGKTGTYSRPVTAMALLEIDLPPKIDDLVSKAKHLKSEKQKQALGDEYFRRGKAFEDGIEIPKQGTKDDHARSYYEAGARLGSTPAKSAIGVFHAQGRGGLPPKDKAALVEYQAAADRGDNRAMRNLALYHSTGRGDLFQDRLKAFNLLKEVRCQLVE